MDDYSLIAMIILIGITTWYAYSTHNILQETRKERKIHRLEKRLDGLYSPLIAQQHYLINPPIIPRAQIGEEVFIPPKYQQYQHFITKITDNLYLTSDKLYPLLKEYLTKWAHTDVPSDRKVQYQKLINSIIEQANKDYREYRERYFELREKE